MCSREGAQQLRNTRDIRYFQLRRMLQNRTILDAEGHSVLRFALADKFLDQLQTAAKLRRAEMTEAEKLAEFLMRSQRQPAHFRLNAGERLRRQSIFLCQFRQ